MKKNFAFLLISILSSCKNDEPPSEPWKPSFLDWEYTANVSIDSELILNHIYAYEHQDTILNIEFASSLPDYSYYYYFGIRLSPFASGTFTIYGLLSGSDVWAGYSEVCCFTEPDQINWTYGAYENDSANNYIRIHKDSVTQELSGMFKCTMISVANQGPYDTLRIQCDTFYCKYSVQ